MSTQPKTIPKRFANTSTPVGILSIATWNVQGGLSRLSNRQLLCEDLAEKKVDIAALQETKVGEFCEYRQLPHGYTLVLLSQDSADAPHGGLGFAFSKRVADYVAGVERHGDRLASVDISLPCRRGHQCLRVVNVYGYTSQRSAKTPKLSQDLYRRLSGICSCSARTCTEELFAANTAFPHPARHRTTWSSSFRNRNGDVCPVFNQIDFVLCRYIHRSILMDARSYSGCGMSSDHRLVVCRIDLSKRYILWKRPVKPKIVKYDTSSLSANHSLQVQLKKEFKTQLSSSSSEDHSAPALWKSLLYLRMQKPSSRDEYEVLRKLRNKIRNELHVLLRDIANKQIDDLATAIQSTDESRRMFEAVRSIKLRQPRSNLCVTDPTTGHYITVDENKATVIADWFSTKFTSTVQGEVDQFVGDPRPLQVPISSDEIVKALSSLKNGRATGPDNLPSECLKYLAEDVALPLATIINTMFQKHEFIDDVGEGILIPLQKPGKPKGPASSLRPVVLLNSIRKVISLVTLQRIRAFVSRYIGITQSGFRRGRSTTDIIWMQRMLQSCVMKKTWQYFIMGIDMSSAFDTISRAHLLDVLHDAGCGEDELRLVRVLLSGTNLTVRVCHSLSEPFSTVTGTPQGDALSPVLFTIYLESSLRKVRTRIPWLPENPLPGDMPHESQYADDVDLMSESNDDLQQALPIIREILQEDHLKVNEGKTTFTRVFLHDDLHQRGSESWRGCRVLGTLLCSSSDITKRCALAANAFRQKASCFTTADVGLLRRRMREG